MNVNSLCPFRPSDLAGCGVVVSPDARDILAECIDEYCGDGASRLLFQPQEEFATAPLWEEAGIAVPPEVALLVELLHRASQRGE